MRIAQQTAVPEKLNDIPSNISEPLSAQHIDVHLSETGSFEPIMLSNAIPNSVIRTESEVSV